MPVFQYGESEISYLKSVDAALARAIEQIGPIRREIIPDLFAALVSSVIGQQISTKAWKTVWNRLLERLGEITPETIGAATAAEIQQCGTSTRKALYIKEAADKVLGGELDIAALNTLPDDEVCRRLSALKGIGLWTAEMLLIFSMQRPNVLSWDDIAIHRGLRMLYRHRSISKKLFEKYKRRYSPYSTVASLYLWEIAGGGCSALKDHAPMTVAEKKRIRRKKSGEKRALAKMKVSRPGEIVGN